MIWYNKNKFFVRVINFIAIKKAIKMEFHKIREKRRISIQNEVELSQEEMKKIDDFYKNYYGKKIPYNWHKEYYSISHSFDYKFFPEFLFIPVFERIMNNPVYFSAFADKNISEIFAKATGNIKTPFTYVRCCNGVFTNSDYSIISKKDIYNFLPKNSQLFIKPTIDSSSGRGCKIIDTNKINESEFYDIIKNYNGNFCIQELVINSKELRKLNSTSLNTFRVITYILDGIVYAMPVILRIGRNGASLDNAHQGGIFIGVNDDGTLKSFATTEFKEQYYVHPDSKIIFENYKINDFEKIVSSAKKLQAMMPQVGCVNWDLTLNSNNEPVLIEANTRGGSIWLIQMAHGVGAFGENTEKILKLVKEKKFKF